MAEKETVVTNPPVGEGSEGKETNKLFTQSEHDAAVAREAKRIADQYKDYAELKKTADALAKEKKERELAEKSEVEKLQLQIKEQEERLTKAESERKRLEVLSLKSDILSKAEFSALPRAYKNMVAGETEADILANANDILKEYEADAKKLNPAVNFRPPVGGVAPSAVANKTLADKVKDTFARRASGYSMPPPVNK